MQLIKSLTSIVFKKVYVLKSSYQLIFLPFTLLRLVLYLLAILILADVSANWTQLLSAFITRKLNFVILLFLILLFLLLFIVTNFWLHLNAKTSRAVNYLTLGFILLHYLVVNFFLQKALNDLSFLKEFLIDSLFPIM